MKFPFELLSDPDEKVCEQLGVMKLKNLYGRKSAASSAAPSWSTNRGCLRANGAVSRCRATSRRY
jgi:thioredoxin-dependent peroxiredoxin